MKSLQVIDLSYNKLTNLEPWFFLLPELILIDASDNRIDRLVNNIGFDIIIKPVKHSDNLTINLEYNKFVYMRLDDVYSYFGVQNLALPVVSIWNMWTTRTVCGLLWDGNPFVCECRLFSVYKSMKGITDMFKYKQDVLICSAPPVLKGQSMRLLEPEQFISDLSNETCPLNCSCIYIPAKQII